jgi:hypothetical protein
MFKQFTHGIRAPWLPHTQGNAIDMSISWGGNLSIVNANGETVIITSTPRTGMNTTLHAVDASYGVIKFVGGAAVRPHQPMVTKHLTVALYVSASLLLASQSTQASPALELLGAYSNQKTSTGVDPHIESYSLTLYREGEIVFGRFCWGTGIEVPCAPIQNASLDQRRNLKFQAKLSIGTEFNKEAGPKGRPAYRLIEFQGKIDHRLLTGKVTTKSGYHPHAPGSITRVKMRRQATPENPISSYQEWAADPVNKPADW